MPDHRPHPRLRWHTEDVTRSPIFVVPGASVGHSSVVPRGKTWGIRERGDTGKLVPHSYRCPVHGVFELRVPVSDVPDEAFCTAEDRCVCLEEDPMMRGQCCPVHDLGRRATHCGLTSPWAGATCAIGIEPGMVTG
jgi:hypothetical protein